MDAAKYMDKRITELSKSHSLNFLFHDDEDDATEEAKERTHGFDFNSVLSLSQPRNKSLGGTSLKGWSSMDHTDSAKISDEKVEIFCNATLISKIDRKMKEHADVMLHAVECLSARVFQMESRTHQLKDAVDDLKESIEFNHGKTDRKLREIKNIFMEVQDGVRDLRDKQEIAEAQLQLEKLRLSKDKQQLEKKNVIAQACLGEEALPSISQQPHQLIPVPVASPQFASSLNVSNLPLHNHPPETPVATAPQLPMQLLQNQNIVPSVTQQESYNPLLIRNPSTHQQYQVPPTQQSQPSRYAHQPYQPPAHFPVTWQLTLLPQVPQPSPIVNPQVHCSSSHQSEVPFMPTQSISQPPGRSPPVQFNVPSTHQIRHLPPNRYYSESPSVSSWAQGLQPQGPANIMGSYQHGAYHRTNFSSSGESSHSQLPIARLLPQAIPTASSVDAATTSSGNGNRVPVDDVVDKVAAMGFRRDLVRATVRNLTENGQSVDFNTVLDKLMNNG